MRASCTRSWRVILRASWSPTRSSCQVSWMLISTPPEWLPGLLTSTSANGDDQVSQRPLSGRRVVTTRDEPGRLDSLLAALGADVVHVPLISIDDPPDGGGSLAAALEQLASYDWLVVTSQHGAERVGAAAARQPSVQLAAVGPRTAARLVELAGRAPAVVRASHCCSPGRSGAWAGVGEGTGVGRAGRPCR